uniref:Protein kinase domain-containing protein n=1 Tax=Meloidogyne hapla TaxID=6305 RepID=A0A1I8BV57_MELHA
MKYNNILIGIHRLNNSSQPCSSLVYNQQCTARRPLHKQQLDAHRPSPQTTAARRQLFIAMSVRPREGDLDVRAGFTFESVTYKYKLEELIGDGGYGQVFEADAVLKGKKTNTKRLAVKLERRSGATDIEARVLEAAKERNCRHIPRIFDHNNNIVAARPDVGWRGTTRYGSRSAHQHQDLARKDDVESWFYMIVEMTRGSLPWSSERGEKTLIYS